MYGDLNNTETFWGVRLVGPEGLVALDRPEGLLCTALYSVIEISLCGTTQPAESRSYAFFICQIC